MLNILEIISPTLKPSGILSPKIPATRIPTTIKTAEVTPFFAARPNNAPSTAISIIVIIDEYGARLAGRKLKDTGGSNFHFTKEALICFTLEFLYSFFTRANFALRSSFFISNSRLRALDLD